MISCAAIGSVLILLAFNAAAKPSVSEWARVVANGEPIGHVQTIESTKKGVLTTETKMAIVFQRQGVPIALTLRTIEVERDDFVPLKFEQSMQGAGTDMRMQGKRLREGLWQIKQQGAVATSQQKLAWPDSGKLSRGAQAILLSRGRSKGTTVSYQLIEPGSDELIDVTVEWMGAEPVQLPEQTLILDHAKVRQKTSGGELVQELWVNEAGETLRTRMPAFGAVLETLSCSKACALTSGKGFDLLQTATVVSPRLLSSAERQRALRYRVKVRGDLQEWPLSAEQVAAQSTEDMAIGANQPSADIKQYDVVVVPNHVAGDTNSVSLNAMTNASDPGRLAPEPRFSESNAWVESDHLLIRKLLLDAGGAKGKSSGDVMSRLTRFVRNHIHDKNLESGFASAVQAARSRSGDCTEHGVLLAALGRGAGIPTRLAAGLVYAEQAGRGEFIPHVWTQAWIDNAWHSFDAALNGFDSGHLMLASSDGNPSSLGYVMASISQIEIAAITETP